MSSSSESDRISGVMILGTTIDASLIKRAAIALSMQFCEDVGSVAAQPLCTSGLASAAALSADTKAAVSAFSWLSSKSRLKLKGDNRVAGGGAVRSGECGGNGIGRD
jgi:hypothetical protein